MSGVENGPLCLDTMFVDGVRDVFARAGFNAVGLVECLGPAASHIEPMTYPMLLRRTARLTPVDVLARIYVMGVSVERDAVDRAVAPMSVAQWIDGGLLCETDEGIGSDFAIFPEEDLLIVADPPAAQARPTRREDHVMGVAATTRDLLRMATEEGVGSMLELGTGCGAVALMQARTGGRVVATDINPRALNVARFNALLNALDVDFREGSLFEPVAGMTFDRVVSNPPFVISPGREFIYRDGGMDGDGFVRTVLEQVPALLNEGGQARILCQWVVTRGADWEERVQQWTESLGCDVLVLQVMRQNIEVYTQNWLGDTRNQSRHDYYDRFQTWIDYFEQAGIESIATGWVILRKRSAAERWSDFSLDADTLGEGAAAQVSQLVANRDFLQSVDRDALLASRPVLAPATRLKQTASARGGTWEPDEVLLAMTEGIRRTVRTDLRIAVVLAAFDGRTTVLEAAARLAAQMGVDARALAGALEGPIRRMFEHGFLVVSD